MLYSGETLWIVAARGVLSLAAIGTLVLAAFFQVLIAPINEMGLTPNAQFRSPEMVEGGMNATQPVVWNVVLVCALRILHICETNNGGINRPGPVVPTLYAL